MRVLTAISMQTLLADVSELVRRVLKILPGPEGPNWADVPAAVWREGQFGGTLVAHPDIDRIGIADLLHVDDQKAALILNTRQFLAGAPANNALLWGAGGTGRVVVPPGALRG